MFPAFLILNRPGFAPGPTSKKTSFKVTHNTKSEDRYFLVLR